MEQRDCMHETKVENYSTLEEKLNSERKMRNQIHNIEVNKSPLGVKDRQQITVLSLQHKIRS